MAIQVTPASKLTATCRACGSKLKFAETDVVSNAEKKIPGLMGNCQYVVCPTCGTVIIVRSEKKGKCSPDIEFEY